MYTVRILTNKKYSVLENEFTSIRGVEFYLKNTPGDHRVYVNHVYYETSVFMSCGNKIAHDTDEEGYQYKFNGSGLYLYNPMQDRYELVMEGVGSIQQLIKQYRESLC